MSENYKPGTVAMVRIHGDEGGPVLAFRDCDPSAIGWSLAERRNASVWVSAGHVTDVRPLVVLDLAAANPWITEDEAAEAAIETLRGSDRISDSGLAAQIEAQTRPPKPAEPTGMGAVVKDSTGELWTNTHQVVAWVHQDRGRAHYRDIDVVRILSEGVEVDR